MNNEFEEIKRKYEERKVNINDIDFNVKVFEHNGNLGFKIIRKVDGFHLNCAFSITKEMLVGNDIKSLSESLDMMFNTSLLEMAYKIRNGLIRDK